MLSSRSLLGVMKIIACSLSTATVNDQLSMPRRRPLFLHAGYVSAAPRLEEPARKTQINKGASPAG
jgi:hypothetical protein